MNNTSVGFTEMEIAGVSPAFWYEWLCPQHTKWAKLNAQTIQISSKPFVHFTNATSW